MNKLISLIALMIILFVSSNAVFAGKIYKWVDKQGEVHYGEHPPSGVSEQMYVPHSSRTSPAPATTPTNKTDDAKKFLDALDKENKEKKEADDKASKEQAIRDKNCTTARKQVATLKQGGRKFEVDEQGNRHYLDDANIQNKLEEAQAAVEKYCQ